MSGPNPQPVLMRDADLISLKEAMRRSGRSAKTIRRWCHKDGIGLSGKTSQQPRVRRAS